MFESAANGLAGDIGIGREGKEGLGCCFERDGDNGDGMTSLILTLLPRCSRSLYLLLTFEKEMGISEMR